MKRKKSQRRRSLRLSLLLIVTASLLTACAGGFQISPAADATAARTSAPSIAPGQTQAPTVTPTEPVQTAASTTETPVIEPTHTDLPQPEPPLPRPPSGWTIFSNPDFVQGVAVHDGSLWSASGGGVVRWDLKTGAPKLYTTQDGLSEIQGNDVVYCSLPEPRMFVAHPSGTLSVYDIALEKWSRMPITFDDGSTMNGVRTLLCDSVNRRLIVGSSDGLGIYDDRTGSWKRFGPEDGLHAETIRAIDVVGQAIWVAAGDRGAYMIMGSTVFPFNRGSGFPSGSINDLVASSDSSVWFGYATGLIHYRDKKWNSYGPQASSGIPFFSIDQVEVGPDRRIWIASAEEGVCPFDTATLFCSTVYPGIRGVAITDLVVDDEGIAYAATDGAGVLVLGEERVRQLAFDLHQMASNDVMDIAQSADGKIWLATDKGLNIFDPTRPFDPWENIEPARGQLAFPNVGGLLPAQNGMWVFYQQEPQASFYDGQNWLQLDDLQGVGGPVKDAEVDQRGYIWFASEQGIRVWDGVVMRVYAPPSAMPTSGFRTLLSEGGDMWVGTTRGLLRYRQSQWHWVLPGITINSIQSDRTGGLLLGTDIGLMRFDGSQSYLWVINLGSETVPGPHVSSTAWDGSGQLWVGTVGDGLFKFDGVRWEQFDTSNGLPTDNIRTVYADSLGEVWIAAVTNGGGALIRYMP